MLEGLQVWNDARDESPWWRRMVRCRDSIDAKCPHLAALNQSCFQGVSIQAPFQVRSVTTFHLTSSGLTASNLTSSIEFDSKRV
jgi:hypothetical protein